MRDQKNAEGGLPGDDVMQHGDVRAPLLAQHNKKQQTEKMPHSSVTARRNKPIAHSSKPNRSDRSDVNCTPMMMSTTTSSSLLPQTGLMVTAAQDSIRSDHAVTSVVQQQPHQEAEELAGPDAGPLHIASSSKLKDESSLAPHSHSPHIDRPLAVSGLRSGVDEEVTTRPLASATTLQHKLQMLTPATYNSLATVPEDVPEVDDFIDHGPFARVHQLLTPCTLSVDEAESVKAHPGTTKAGTEVVEVQPGTSTAGVQGVEEQAGTTKAGNEGVKVQPGTTAAGIQCR
jgi:hypothetical protein